jgi:hypothetical protein
MLINKLGVRMNRRIYRTVLLVMAACLAVIMGGGAASAAPFVQPPGDNIFRYQGYPKIGAPWIAGNNDNNSACNYTPATGQPILPSSMECGVSRVNQFMNAVYTANGHAVPIGYQVIPQYSGGFVMGIDTTNVMGSNVCLWATGLTNYCPVTGMVNVGIANAMHPASGSGGKFIAAITLAHETGHAAASQTWSGGTDNLARPFPTKTQPEDQADCFSGVFVKYGIDQGWWSTSAIDEGAAFWYSLGVDEIGVTAHNLKAERARYFRMGAEASSVNDGLVACMAIVTDNRPLAPWLL